MKKTTTIMFCLLLSVSVKTFSQECDNLLQNGLYSFTGMTNTGSFNQDLRTYYLSEQFSKDMRSGKWGSSITIPIEGIPVSLGMTDSEEKYNEFHSKLLKTAELKISSAYYQTSFSTIPNTSLYSAYVECVKIKNDVSKVGFIQGENVETENIVIFTIYYRPQAPADPMPTVKSFNVQPEGSVISGGLKAGDKLNSFSILVTCKRDQEKDLVLTIETDRGPFTSKSSADGAFSTSKEIPLGTIICSYLNFEQFSLASKSNEKSPGGIWTSQKSKWAPCDGRPLPNSKFSVIASQPNAPDFRGVFIRGLNSFDPGYTIDPKDKSQLNPNPTSLAVYQPDEFKSHNHDVTGNTLTFAHPEYPGMGMQSDNKQQFTFPKPNISIGNRGGDETRPKNVSVYYYIKIN